MRILLIIFLALTLTACVSAEGNKQIGNDELISKIEKGVTTKTEVTEMFGDPTRIEFIANDEEIWYYEYTRSEIRGTSFIPYVGLFAGGADTQQNSLVINFDRRGVVKRFGKGGSTGGGGGLQDRNR